MENIKTLFGLLNGITIDDDRNDNGALSDEHSKAETLATVSSDGRVSQWTVRKGLEYADLMNLKRVVRRSEDSKGDSNTAASKSSKSSSFISRSSGGLCFDFHPKDASIYIVGTDDGHVYAKTS